MREIGINLFTLHKFIKTEEGLLETALRLKELGYTYLQYSGAEFDAERIKRVSDASGMPFVLTHVPLDRILHDTERLMEEHDLFGCKNIGLGALSPEVLADEHTAKTKIEELNLAGERMAKGGFKFYYHNHHMEFMRHSGKTVYDYMIENAPYINFTFDTYWAQFGGVDVLGLIRKLEGRVECVHLKDYKVVFEEGDADCKPVFAPVGEGNLNFPEIVRAARSSGAKYFFVEQDNACILPDPWGEVTKSVNYIKERL